MKKFFMMAALSAGLLFSACSGNKGGENAGSDSAAKAATEADGSKVLVAYYSATGTTAKAAEEIANLLYTDNRFWDFLILHFRYHPALSQ